MLDDVLAAGLAAVFCGTAASPTSARRGAYYAGPGNQFWPILHRTGLLPRRLAPEEYRLMPSFGFGLTDLVKGKAGVDTALVPADYDREAFVAKMRLYRPGLVCFTSKQAAKVFLTRPQVAYGRVDDTTLDRIPLFVAPSPSGAARGHWDEAWWHELAALVRG